MWQQKWNHPAWQAWDFSIAHQSKYPATTTQQQYDEQETTKLLETRFARRISSTVQWSLVFCFVFVSEWFSCSSSNLRIFDKTCGWELWSALLLGVEQEWIRPDPCICQRVATLSCILDNSSCHPAYYEWVKLPTEWMATFQMTRAAKMIQGKSLSMSHNISPSRTKWMGSDGKMNESLHS